MTTEPGADERRIRSILRHRGVGPDALPPSPTAARSDDHDWWDVLYAPDVADTRPDKPGQAADKARTGGGRLPDWRKGETADLGGHGPDTADTTEDKPAPDTEEPDSRHSEVGDDQEEERETSPRPAPARQAGRRVHAAYAQLAPRTRVLIYNGTAAALGWSLGLEPLIQSWITGCQHDTGHVATALILATGLVLATGVLVDRRTRGWWGPLPWICRIPLASAILATLLYAPGVTS